MYKHFKSYNVQFLRLLINFELKFTLLNLKILSKKKVKVILNKNNPRVEVIWGKYKDQKNKKNFYQDCKYKHLFSEFSTVRYF